MYTLYKFHFLNGISEINQLFDDILIIWPTPVYIYIYIYIYIYTHTHTHTLATLLGTPLLVPVGPPFSFRTALILRGIDSTRCWKHCSEILVHIIMIASHSCCRFVVCTSMMWISRSTTSQRYSIGLRSGDCGGHLSKVNSLSCSRNQSEMIWALWHEWQVDAAATLGGRGFSDQLHPPPTFFFINAKAPKIKVQKITLCTNGWHYLQSTVLHACNNK